DLERFNFEQALGLRPDENDPLKLRPRLQEESLLELSQFLGKTSWYDTISKTSDEELKQIRDEVRTVLVTLESTSAVAKEIFGKKLFWFVAIGDWLRMMSQREQALLLIFWRIIGKSKLKSGM